MLDLTDDRWLQLTSGYRKPFDARPLLARLRAGDDDEAAWHELWDKLYHQDDIGTASLAVVPHLVSLHAHRAVADWQTYAFAGSVELRRGVDRNPDLPAWLADGYHQAWREILPLALRDLAGPGPAPLVQATLAVIAIARGHRRAGELVLTFTDDELAELLEQHGDE